MRFRLLLETNRRAFGNILPIDYQYAQSAAIYKILSCANKDYATWLHNNGFRTDSGQHFKLFTYSPFFISGFKQIGDRLAVLSDTVEWQLSFLPEKSTETFIQGIFSNQTFEIGDATSVVQFHVRNVEVLPSPEYQETMEFQAMSPIFIKLIKEDGRQEYLSPEDSRAGRLIFGGLKNRYKAFTGTAYTGSENFAFEVLSKPKSKLITIKKGTPEESKLRAYRCNFRMTAPQDLMRIAYESGVGSENSQGFGCVRIKKPPIIKD
jgi:CRISPR-associated endoribonuclease Cas6